MKISRIWLNEYISCDITTNKLCKILTDIGFEVEGIEIFNSLNIYFSGLVVGEILFFEKHHYIDNIQLTKVDIRQKKPLNIVCRDHNIFFGQKVIVATPDAYILDNNGTKHFFKKPEIEGVLYDGIICSEQDLGLKKKSYDILKISKNVRPGTPADRYIKRYKDEIIKINMPTNRCDATSHWGLARDLYAALKIRKYAAYLRYPINNNISFFKKKSISPRVAFEANYHFLRYSCCMIYGLKIGPSPLWLQNFLQSIGLKTINNVLDIINFVTHELGQTLNVFDADSIKGNTIYVRKLNQETFFLTRDNIELNITTEDLVICDKENILCLAGILSEKNCSITPKTVNIYIDSVCFNYSKISKNLKKINTSATFCFQRSTDPQQVLKAIERAALLIQKIAGGEIYEPIDIYPKIIYGTEVILNYKKIRNLIGHNILKIIFRKILSLLEIHLLSEKENVFKVIVPFSKVYVQCEIDLIEEIFRISGFNRIKASDNIRLSIITEKYTAYEDLEEKISKILNAQGFYEVVNISLNNISYILKKCGPVELLNPFSRELSLLRQSLIFGLLENIRFNINRKNYELKFFEFGKTYSKINENFNETPYLGLISTGQKLTLPKNHWISEKGKFNFFELKGLIECLLKQAGLLSYKQEIEHDDLLEKTLVFKKDNWKISSMGRVKNTLIKEFDLDQEIFYAEINFEVFFKIINNEKFKPISKYPGVRRDLAILVDKKKNFEIISRTIRSLELRYLKDITLFDTYEGENIPHGNKSYALGFYFEDPEKTITKERVNSIMENIYIILKTKLGVKLRS